MKTHEFTGKTTEEAINEGLRSLGLTISDVKVEVLEEGAKGLFGLFGSKPARVRLTMDDQGDEVLAALSSMTLDSFNTRDRGAERPARAERPEPAKTSKPAKPAAPAASRPAPQRNTPADRTAVTPQARPQRPPRVERPHAPVSEHNFKPQPLPEGQAPMVHEPGTPQGRAQQFLLEVTRMMGVPVQVDVQTDPDGNLFAQVIGDTLGILIGRRGETLDALQYLTSLQVNKGSEDYIRVTLDTENYRAKREDSLRRLASRMAARACKTGRRVSMEPMNPYERRILHASLQNHPQVTTHSEGEEPNRHVVITLKDDAGQRKPGPR